MTKRIFVTGAAGFIGFHLCKKLLQAKNTVYGIDNYNDYYDVSLKRDRSSILREESLEIKNLDLSDFAGLKAAIEDFQPTHVVHLAAQAGVRYSLVNPNSYVQSNLVGFVNLLEVLKDFPKIKLVYASSSSVYGSNTRVPFSEKDKTDCPKNLYGATKKANELIAYAYHSLYQNKMIGLRFFTVYGPWGRPDMAYYLFAKKMIKNEPIDVYEGKEIKRDFTYIDDIVEGILASIECELDFEVFNLGNHKPVLLDEFIEILEDSLGRKAIKNRRPQAQGDMKETYADISSSQKHLNFSPKTDLREGLKYFSQWFEQYHCQEQKLLQSS